MTNDINSTPQPAPLLLAPRRRGRRGLVAAIAVVCLAALFAGGVVVVERRSEPSGYRTAAVTTKDLSQTLDEVGVVEPVTQAEVAFPVAGTVASVGVHVGQTVAIGQSLATLDASSLEVTIRAKQAALDAANLTLQKALDGQSVGGLNALAQSDAIVTGGQSYILLAATSPATTSTTLTTTTTTTTTTPTTSTTTPTTSTTTPGTRGSTTPGTRGSTTPGAPGSSGASAIEAQVRAAQQAVLAGEKAVDSALETAQQALDSATRICAAVTTPTTAVARTSPSTTVAAGATSAAAASKPGSTTTTTTPSTGGGGTGGIEACQLALQKVLDAQQAVKDDQTSLNTAASNLDTLLAKLASTASSTPSTSKGGSSRSGSSGGSSGSGASKSGSSSHASSGSSSHASSGSSSHASSGSSGGASAAAPSAADLIAYQKQVDAAAANLVVAQAALKQATLPSPISGKVIAINLAVGDDVQAASTSADIIVGGAGGYEVTATVSVNDLPHVQLGQGAVVVPDGQGTRVTGKVVAIGAPATSNTGVTTCPVTIGLHDASLLDGSIATVLIVTAAANGVLAVPTSAVHTIGTLHTVTVLDGTTLHTVIVRTGVSGATWTEITSGVQAGEQVVLADIAQPLPNSATSNSNARTTGTNGLFPGVGRGAGGAGGAGGTGGRRGGG